MTTSHDDVPRAAWARVRVDYVLLAAACVVMVATGSLLAASALFFAAILWLAFAYWPRGEGAARMQAQAVATIACLTAAEVGVAFELWALAIGALIVAAVAAPRPWVRAVAPSKSTSFESPGA